MISTLIPGTTIQGLVDKELESADTLALTIYTGIRKVSEEPFAQIYGNNNISLGLDVALCLHKIFEIFIHSDFLSAEGKTSFTGDKTSLTILPLELGLRFKLKRGIFFPYLGGGAGYYFFNEESTFASEAYTSQVNGFGFFGESGVRVRIIKKWHLDLKVRYTSFKLKPIELEETNGQIVYSSERNLSGLTIALGFGISI